MKNNIIKVEISINTLALKIEEFVHERRRAISTFLKYVNNV